MTEETFIKMRNALGVIVHCPEIVEWLKENDPQALKQAKEAYKAAEKEC